MPSQSRFARQLPRKRGSQNVTFRLGLPRVRGRWPAGPERATNNAGASLTASPRRGTLSFVTQKFFCFGAINNRRNIGVLFPFVVTGKGWCQTGRRLLNLPASYINPGMVRLGLL